MRGLSLVAASGGHSSSRCVGLSLSRPLLLRSTGSRHAGSVIVAHGPSCSAACGISPDQGSNPCPLHWQADSQPLRHQGSPPTNFLKIWCHLVWIALYSVSKKLCDNWGSLQHSKLGILSVRTKTVVHRAGLESCLCWAEISAHLFEQACTPLCYDFSELSAGSCRSYILSGWLMIYSLFSWAILWFHHINSSLVSFLEYLECYLLFGLPQTSVEWDLSHDLFDLFEGRKAEAYFWWERGLLLIK